MNFKMLYAAMNVIIVCHMIDMCAMRRVYSLPVQIPQKKDIAQKTQEKAKAKEEQAQKLISLYKQDSVFLKTKTDTIFTFPRWQINQMPILSKKVSEQKNNNLNNPLDVSSINGGIDDEELRLLSDTWNHMRNNQALPFLDSLKMQSLPILQGAAEKVGSSLLYATIFDYLLPRELWRKPIEPLIAPLIQLLEGARYAALQNERLFKGVANKEHNPESPDGTKRIGIKGNTVFLYDEINNFIPQELASNDNVRYVFSSDSRMVVAIANNKGVPLRCWDTHNNCKRYTIQCSNFVVDVEFSADGKTLVFTERDEPVTKTEDKGNKLYACNLSEDNPVSQEMAWMGNYPISSITVSPDNSKLVCTSGDDIYFYNNFYSMPFGSLVAERIEDSLLSIKSVIFTSDGTKFLCLPSEVKMSFVLYKSNGDLEAIPMTDMVVIKSVCFNPAGTVCIIKTSNTLLYWDISAQNLNIDKIVYRSSSIDSIEKISFSPDSKWCAFTDKNCLCYFNVDDFKIHKICENPNSKIKSVHFSSDKELSVLVEDIDSITKKDYTFEYEDLKKCTVGQGEMLAKLYYTYLLKNAGKDKTSIDITKGSLSYELFKALPLQDIVMRLLNIRIIDNPEPIQKEYDQMAIEEFLPKEVEGITKKAREIAMENLRQYLEKEKPALEEVRKRMEGERIAAESLQLQQETQLKKIKERLRSDQAFIYQDNTVNGIIIPKKILYLCNNIVKVWGIDSEKKLAIPIPYPFDIIQNVFMFLEHGTDHQKIEKLGIENLIVFYNFAKDYLGVADSENIFVAAIIIKIKNIISQLQQIRKDINSIVTYFPEGHTSRGLFAAIKISKDKIVEIKNSLIKINCEDLHFISPDLNKNIMNGLGRYLDIERGESEVRILNEQLLRAYFNGWKIYYNVAFNEFSVYALLNRMKDFLALLLSNKEKVINDLEKREQGIIPRLRRLIDA